MDQLLHFVGLHPVLFSALGVAAILLILNEMSGIVTGEKRLSPLEAVRLINDRQALVLDVRPPSDYKKGHILDALNVPQTKLGERLGELGKDTARPIVVYCALGGVSAQAAHTLKKAGYAEVYPIRGGLNGWLGANLPVTTREGRRLKMLTVTKIVMYSTRWCPFCVMAKRLLAAKGVAVEEVAVDSDPARRVEMVQRSGRRTVPQIFVGERHIGGFEDMAELDHKGELDPLLADATRSGA